MSYALESLEQRDRRIAWERRLRIAVKLGGYVLASVLGVIVATPVAYRNGYDAGKEFQAELVKPTCQAPEAKVTPAQVARDKYLKKCAENLRNSITVK